MCEKIELCNLFFWSDTFSSVSLDTFKVSISIFLLQSGVDQSSHRFATSSLTCAWIYTQEIKIRENTNLTFVYF